MRKCMRVAVAVCLISAMAAGTAFAGTWEANTYQSPEPYESDYQSGQTSLKTYSGFTDDRSQATLVNYDWKYKKDDGSYAVSEWVQDDAGQSYYVGPRGRVYQGYVDAGSIDGNAYFFEPSDGHMITDAILSVDSVGGWDVDYTVNADGTWDFKPWDGFDIANYQFTNYLYFDDKGIQAMNGEIPGGTVVNGLVQNVVREVDGDGVPVLNVNGVRYRAVKSSSWDKTAVDTEGVDGIYAKSAYHEFRTVYVRE